MRARVVLLLVVFLVVALAPGLALAGVEMNAQVNATRVQVGDTFQLDVIITADNVRGRGEPDELVQPDIGDFELVGSDRAPTRAQTTIVNGQMQSSRSFGLVYYLRADTPGEKTIGGGRVRIGKETATTKPITIEVLARGANKDKSTSSELDPAARFVGREVPPYFVDARFDKDEAYLGEQLLFSVHVYATEYIDLDLRELDPPKPPGFWVEIIDTPTRIRPTQRSVGGREYLVYETLRLALFPLEEGEHVIDPLQLTVATTRGGWRRRNKVQLASDPVSVTVKPLPTAGQPADFEPGNVGVWRLRAEVSERKVPEGQPVTLRLRAGGEGNLGGLTLPRLEELAGARVFPPTTSETKGVTAGRLHGEKTLEMLVQPLAPGTLRIPGFKLAFFNPQTERYESARTQPLAVEVVPAGAAAGGARARGRVEGARPIARGLTAPTSASAPPYASPGYLAALAACVLGGAFGFGAGALRAGRGQSADATRRRRAKARRRELDAAREDKDLAATERVVLGAVAERFGDEVRALASDALATHLDGRLAAEPRARLVAWLDAAQAARYAPQGSADRKRLFDEAGPLLDALEEDAA